MTDEATTRHDVILVGAGVAGSRLLVHLLASAWRDRQILVIERERGGHDHALAFWTARSSALDPLIERHYTTLRVVTAAGEQLQRADEQRYVATRRARVTELATRSALTRANVQWLTGAVEEVVDGPHEAAVRVGDRWYRGRWIFDSRRAPAGPATVRLVQRFTGWTIESPHLNLDPSVATLFDFRTPQADGFEFVYVLPFAADRALVEHVSTGPKSGGPTQPEALLASYVQTHLGLHDGSYTIVGREQGESPLSDARHARRGGARICNIGVRGGRLKPSSGYALMRIERDSAAIVGSLLRYDHPFRLPRERRWYRALDAIFLGVLAREPRRAPGIFAALMRRPDATLRFLDERARPLDLLRILLLLPTWAFVRAAWRWLWARRRAG